MNYIEYIFVISGGHGGFGVTPGKRTPKFPDGKVMYEFDFNNPTAQYLGAALQQYENVEVHYVHDLTGETDVSLTERISFANKLYNKHLKAIKEGKVKIIYLSVHANADGSGSTFTDAHGIEVLVHHSKPKEAQELAANVQNELIRETGRRNRGLKYRDNLGELNDTKMTSLIAECGFMTNLEEANLLLRDDYRKKCANAIKEGVVKTFKLQSKISRSGKPAKAKKEQVKLIIETNDINAKKLLEEFTKQRGYKAYIEA